MFKPNQFLLFFSLLALPCLVFAEESMTITTYYPSPYGVYRELRSQRMAIGDAYYDTSQYCWSPDSCTTTINANADLVVEGNVGIGTTGPGTRLTVMTSNDVNQALFSRDGSNGIFVMGNNSGAVRNWQISNNFIGAGMLNLTPSTANGGTTFTTPALTILDAGNVGIGTTSPGTWKLRVAGGSAAVDTGESWTTASDARLKKDILPVSQALARVSQLQGVMYHTLEEREADPKHLGLVAQEVEKIVPELVLTGEDGYKGLDYGRFSALLVEAIKELKAENDALKARIEALEAKLKESEGTK